MRSDPARPDFFADDATLVDGMSEGPRTAPRRARMGTLMEPGALLAGKFTLISPIGAGGMGAVWAAMHLGLGRKVALKVLRRDKRDDPTARERFRREAMCSAALDHPGIVRALDFGTIDDGSDYLALEFVDGRTLEDLLTKGGPLPPALILKIASEVLDALAHAHERGIVHRDLKPSNLIVEGGDPARGRTRLLDLGIARSETQRFGPALTEQGIVLGTPSHMAPELFHGSPASTLSDVYALGVVLYRAITGRVPHVGTSLPQILGSLKKGAPPSPAQLRPDPARPAALDNLVLAMLAHDPAVRPDAEEARERLAKITSGRQEANTADHSTVSGRAKWIGIALAGAMGLALGAAAMWALSMF